MVVVVVAASVASSAADDGRTRSSVLKTYGRLFARLVKKVSCFLGEK